MRVFTFAIGICCALLSATIASAQSNSGLVYTGRVLNPDGSPLTEDGVQFRVRIYGSSDYSVTSSDVASLTSTRCLLYEETHTVNMSGSMGAFELAIGSGSSPIPSTWSSVSSYIFKNNRPGSTSYVTAVSCDNGGVGAKFFANSLTKDRELEVSITTSTATIDLSAMSIKSVPYANQAASLNGFSDQNLLRMSQSATSNILFTSTNVDILSILANASTIQSSSISGSGLTGKVLFGANALKVGTPTESDSVASKSYVDTSVAAAVSAGVTAGSITSTEIASGAVGSDEILDGSVSSTDILNGTISGTDLATGAVDLSTNKVTGTLPITAGGTGLTAVGSANQVLTVNATGTALEYKTPSSGTVTSVGLSMPAIFTVSNSPVTSSGSLTVSVATQNANLVWAGPSTGAAAAPSFRALVADDIPKSITLAASAADNAGAIDFSTGNVQWTTNSCGALSLHNLKAGGTYTLVVQNTTSATCTFSMFSDAGTTSISGGNVRFMPANGPTVSGKHTVYNIQVIDTSAYVAWASL